MKFFITTLFCFLFFFSCQSSGTGHLIKITDHESEYQVHDPGLLNRVKFEKALKKYLKTTDIVYTESLTHADPKYILRNISKYTIEYAGLVINGKKTIYCKMILNFDEMHPEKQGISEASEFSIIFDGGCDIIDVTYDPVEGLVTSIICNGYA